MSRHAPGKIMNRQSEVVAERDLCQKTAPYSGSGPGHSLEAPKTCRCGPRPTARVLVRRRPARRPRPSINTVSANGETRASAGSTHYSARRTGPGPRQSRHCAPRLHPRTQTSIRVSALFGAPDCPTTKMGWERIDRPIGFAQDIRRDLAGGAMVFQHPDRLARATST